MRRSHRQPTLRTGDLQRDTERQAEARVDRNGRRSYLIAFSGPIAQRSTDALRAAGAELVAYIPDCAYKAILTPAQAARVVDVEAVTSVAVFQPDYKLSPDLQESPLYSVRLERGVNVAVRRIGFGANTSPV